MGNFDPLEVLVRSSETQVVFHYCTRVLLNCLVLFLNHSKLELLTPRMTKTIIIIMKNIELFD